MLEETRTTIPVLRSACDAPGGLQPAEVREASLAQLTQPGPIQSWQLKRSRGLTRAWTWARNNDFKRAQDYQRRADAIDGSHSLPEDLVAMAKAAAESGDQESLRRVWARFLLQQRQIPSWLYKHVAEAYLQLGDSYRQQANAAEEQARLRELEATAERLREQAKGQTERIK